MPASDPDTHAQQSKVASRQPGLFLAEIFPEHCIEFIDGCKGFDAVIRQLVETLCKAGRIGQQHVDPMITEFLQRERLVSSALGRGLAFPHIRSRHVSEFVGAIGVAPTGFNLSSRDGKPSKLVILIVSPWEQRELHLGLLSRTVSLMEDKAIQLRMDSTISLRDVWQHLKDLDGRSETLDQRDPNERSDLP